MLQEGSEQLTFLKGHWQHARNEVWSTANETCQWLEPDWSSGTGGKWADVEFVREAGLLVARQGEVKETEN